METKRCGRCGETKSVSGFNRREARRQGLQSRCRACNSEYLKQHYRDNPDYYKAKAKRTNEATKRRYHARLLAYFAEHPCVDCGETDPVVLQFDHVRGEKLGCVGELVTHTYSWQRIEAEIAKCEVRCANCHLAKDGSTVRLVRLRRSVT